MALHGILVVDKPPGPSSAQVVSRIKKALDQKKVGHTGTLDPLATGVLPICLGEGTKIAGYLLADDKDYDAEFVLGVETDTLDSEGDVVARDEAGAAAVTMQRLRAAVEAKLGHSEQMPPMYSALKRDGVPLYKLARDGIEVERATRPIVIKSIALSSYQSPRARISVSCSKGTYIRTLVADIGRDLGCGAHLCELRRTRSGPFLLADAVALADVTRQTATERLLNLADVLPMAALTVPPGELHKVENGLQLRWEQVSDGPELTGVFRMLRPTGELLALAEIDSGQLRYRRVFTYRLT